MISSKNIAGAVIEMLDTHPRDTNLISEKVHIFLNTYSLQVQLPKIISYLIREQNTRNKVNTLKINSPFVLNTKNVDFIKGYLDLDHNIPSTITLNSELLGGFIAYYKDKKIDASVLQTLTNLHQSLVKK